MTLTRPRSSAPYGPTNGKFTPTARTGIFLPRCSPSFGSSQQRCHYEPQTRRFTDPSHLSLKTGALDKNVSTQGTQSYIPASGYRLGLFLGFSRGIQEDR
jgi:hypothetical protein